MTANLVDLDRIPEDLKRLPQWVVWRLESRGGKQTKPPRDPKNGNLASSTDATTWATFDGAAQAYEQGNYVGIGFVFTADDPYLGVDIDNCIDEHNILAEAAGNLIDRLHSYSEESPSGRGVHILIRASLPAGGNRCDLNGLKLELYDRRRYFTLTGKLLPASPATIDDRQDELVALHSELFQKPDRSQAVPPQPLQGDNEPLADDELIERAMAARNGDKFARLWRGDISGYPSASEADEALCGLLAFWARRDAARIDVLFRRSGLMRDKWQRADYRNRTITWAVDNCREVFTGPGPTALAVTGPAPVRLEFKSAGREQVDVIVRRGDAVLDVYRGDPRRDSFREKTAKRICERFGGYSLEQAQADLRRIAKEIALPPEMSDADRKAMSDYADRSDSQIRTELLEEHDETVERRLAAMPDEVKERAAALLADPRLVDRILETTYEIGVVGESVLCLALYVIGTSRLLERPLAAILQGVTASGKSYAIEQVAKAFPPEAVLIATDITPNALYHLKPGSLMHRFVVAGERSRIPNDERAEATRALREMMSSGNLRKLVPENLGGVIKTILKLQHGPIAFVESTTLATIFDEDQNRCLMIATDETPEQTKAVVMAIGSQALHGQSGTSNLAVHHAAQRMLRRVKVTIPYATLLAEKMPCARPEARRAIRQTLGMVEAIALLHQRQRADHELQHGDEIEANIADYRVARELLMGPLGRTLGGDLPVAVTRFGCRLWARYGAEEFTSTAACGDDPILKGKSRVNEYLRSLQEAGYAEVIEPGKGPKPATWEMLGEPSDAGAKWLPEPEEIADAS